MAGKRAAWSGSFAFVLAAVGSAVGLGNIWKFPYITGVNGGGAFVLIYLAAIAIVGIPIFLAELYIGQTSQKNAVLAFEVLHKPKTPWRFVGVMGVLSSLIILSFYSVVGGWVLDFEWRSLTNQFAGHDEEEIKGFLNSLFGNATRQLLWHLFFMSCTVAVVLGGIRGGIERANRILMPLLCLLLFGLLGYACFLSGFGEAISFLFSPDTSKLSWKAVLEAVGHSFFTLSLGLGAIITYGSYLSENTGLVRTAIAVAFLDTLFALVAGIIIFSVVFTHGLEPGGGPTLMFQTLPVLFSTMPGGYLISIAFFLLVGFAAFTSAISLLEVVVSYFVDSFQVERKKATILSGVGIFFLGILSALSFNILAEVKLGSLNMFDIFDKLTSNITLPLGGLLISVYYGWVLGPKAVEASMGNRMEPYFTAILWITRILAPAAVAYILFQGAQNLAKAVF